MKKVLVIVGPTAVGKTALSIKLAKKLNGEIISGDSMQVYKGLDIGTAKVTEEERDGIVHHLIDCRDVSETYSAADFQKEGRLAIDSIVKKGKLPIVVGGTGLYVQALLYDFELGSQDESTEIRDKYRQFAEANGNQQLWELLQEKDPQAAESIHFNNQVKVIRALEVFDKTGHSILAPKKAPKQLYDYLLIGLETDRGLLYDRINTRVDLMIEQGLLNEAGLLHQRQTQQSIQGIGYKEFFPYFEGRETLEEAIEQVKQNSRRYAKRQLTWFRNRMNASWWDLVQTPETILELEKEIEDWLYSSEG
ncbi:tRNA (adenosine(37)-N6)-dimethylallyltransferase MiaA [Enterococcus quebecensis]|uniref:tRNA dimethylallyltransferase n=1 Tax=Enterococcus quebecensis TaxID=903983 RepID=A0A1E5GWY2_9ENTE|nr:tRNA (adenosine(37)-N6)-dimethylallyltransferase MiaA [Enterococcus quebecensis]OEG17177.1 tRNA (adenosine(37)-N6)-dimethylallyltransferase MiaA [Enterococcus quebecensis]OJG75567.1 tRNA dimethylallyltransferase [Enterococcus quebecensis]